MILYFIFLGGELKAQYPDSNAILAIYYYGHYEAHYTATLPTHLEKEGCVLDFEKDLKLYQYRYFTTIPLPEKKNSSLFKIFKSKHTEKTVKEDLRKYFEKSKERAWVNIRKHLSEQLQHDYESIKNCIAFENLDFRAVVIEEVRR